MRGIRLSDRVFIVGQTGKGKTTLARYLIGQLQPVRTIVFDPKEEFELGVPIARTPEELEAAIAAPVVHYVPASFERAELERACQIVWLTLGPYIWLIDEASELSSPSWCPAGLRLGVTQGRKPRKMVIALTQRIAETHPVFRSQSEHVFLFVPPPIELDLRTIAGNVRRTAEQLQAELAGLHAGQGDYSHLWYVRDTDELRACAPVPAGERTWPPPSPPAAPEQPEAASTP